MMALMEKHHLNQDKLLEYLNSYIWIKVSQRLEIVQHFLIGNP